MKTLISFLAYVLVALVLAAAIIFCTMFPLAVMIIGGTTLLLLIVILAIQYPVL